MIKRNIPNFFTLLNLLMGCFALVMVFRHDFQLTAYFVLLAAVFDFVDGFVARLLKVSSPLGKELDSLCDVVSFGVVPGFVVYHMISFAVGNKLLKPEPENPMFYLAWTGFLIPLMSAFRLAKFNLDQRQSFGFRGLPTPANALVIVFLPLATNSEQFPFWSNLFSEPWVLTFVTLLLSWLLISDLPLMAMKFKSFSWQDNKVKYLFFLFMICSVMFLRFWAAPFLLLIYITLSQFEKKENPES